MDWQIDGHKQQLKFLETAMERGKLAHAYIFAGPAGVGKKSVAKKLAQFLLGEHGFQPDYLEVAGDGVIKIDQIRNLVYQLSLKPYASPYKVAVIDQAETMTNEAANALLKSMEEPKPYNVIILITANPTRLPKTILSRGQKITFGPLSGREDKILNETPEALKYFEAFSSKSLVDRLMAAHEIADLETADIGKILNAWLVKLQTQLRHQPSMQMAATIRSVAQALKFLDQNVNSKLLLTNLMIQTA